MLNFLPWLIKHHLYRGPSAHPAKLNFVHKPCVHALQNDILTVVMFKLSSFSDQLPHIVALDEVKRIPFRDGINGI
jgi:hypothetical protein